MTLSKEEIDKLFPQEATKLAKISPRVYDKNKPHHQLFKEYKLAEEVNPKPPIKSEPGIIDKLAASVLMIVAVVLILGFLTIVMNFCNTMEREQAKELLRN